MKKFTTLKKRDEERFKGHIIITFLLCTLGVFLLAEISLFIVYNVLNIQDSDAYTVGLFVVPGVAVALTGLIIYLNYRTYLRLQKLIDGLNKVADGDFNFRIDGKKNDAFNDVFDNFNKMAGELSAIKALRENFVHDFSHEFKTPIACINGFANLLLEGNLSQEDQKQFLQIIADESQRLSRLSESTLLLSSLDNSNFIGEKKPYRLDLQIKDCVIMLERKWEEKNLTLNTALQQAEFCGNAETMQQVWVNLLVNAIKFTPANGEINITLKVVGGKIRVVVADNGVGMSQEVKERIFEKYYQGDKSRSTEGNGLGLSIVKRIVDLHDGEILVESNLDEGSVFTVILP